MPMTILKGLSESGVTMHRMVEALDEGDIILKEKVPVYPDDDLMTLTKRQWSVIPKMVETLVSDFDRLWDNAYPQEGVTEYWEMPREADYTITTDTPYLQADRILRAFYGYECIYVDSTGNRNDHYELIEARAHSRNNKKTPLPDDHDAPFVFPIEGGFITCSRVRKLER